MLCKNLNIFCCFLKRYNALVSVVMFNPGECNPSVEMSLNSLPDFKV